MNDEYPNQRLPPCFAATSALPPRTSPTRSSQKHIRSSESPSRKSDNPDPPPALRREWVSCGIICASRYLLPLRTPRWARPPPPPAGSSRPASIAARGLATSFQPRRLAPRHLLNKSRSSHPDRRRPLVCRPARCCRQYERPPLPGLWGEAFRYSVLVPTTAAHSRPRRSRIPEWFGRRERRSRPAPPRHLSESLLGRLRRSAIR